MGRRAHPEMVRLTARVPRGQDGFWSLMRELDTRGPWTVADIDALSNVPQRETIHDYVKRLVRAGFVHCVGEQPTDKGGSAAKRYRLLKRPTDAPSLRRDGTILPVPAQQRLWNAIRTLKQFDLKDLAFAAADDRGEVQRLTTRRYVHHLMSAGYVLALPGGLFRFKRSMDTGPRAPKVLRLHVVWDCNRNVVMGDNVDAEDAP